MVETEVGGVDNIHIIVKKINATDLNKQDIILTYKAANPSIVNKLNKTIIARDVYEKYVSNYYDDHHVESYNLEFKYFVKNCLDELEHLGLITDWTSNMEKYA